MCDIRNAMLAFIIRYKRAHDGNSPTYREIMRAVGINSTSVVAYHLDHLEAAGLIERPQEVGNSRVIEVVGGQWIHPAGDPLAWQNRQAGSGHAGGQK